MKFSIPFIPDAAYAAFLADRRQELASVYFPLEAFDVWDSRVRPNNGAGVNTDLFAGYLKKLKGVRCDILINTRFVTPETYGDASVLNRFLDLVAGLFEKVPVSGIVISDFYLLNALNRTGHPVVAQLEAVPGVNAMLDRFQKIQACLDLIRGTRFKMPGRILIDRSLNREMARLTALAARIREELPDAGIELLANEGCLLHCPFKPAHDAQIALSNTGLVREATWQISQTIGCHDYLFNQPERVLKSPFIRPEDLSRYTAVADTIKICGRTLGTGFLTRCLTAYMNRSFDGNLLDLLDAAHFLGDHFHLDNKRLDPDFFETLSDCTDQCKTCNVCKRLFLNAANKKSTRLKFYKDVK